MVIVSVCQEALLRYRSRPASNQGQSAADGSETCVVIRAKFVQGISHRYISRFVYLSHSCAWQSNSRRASLGSTQRRNSKRRNAKQLWYKNKDLLLPVLGTLTALLLAFAAYKAWDSIEPGLNATRCCTFVKHL